MGTVNPDAVEATETQVRASIRKHQQRFQKARGSKALAELVADAYVLIRTAWSVLTADEQAAILDQHGIAAAAQGTSRYTPWIKLVWGEADPEKTVKDSDGTMRPLWVPDRSMEIYHHTMEELERLGVTLDHADAIMKLGGAAAMAKGRKARLREGEKSKQQADHQAMQDAKRELFLTEMTDAAVEVPLDLPEDLGEFFTLLCRRGEGSQVSVLCVADRNADAIINRIAIREYDELLKAAEARWETEQREKEIRLRVEAARAEERKLLVNAKPEILRRLRAEMSNSVGGDT